MPTLPPGGRIAPQHRGVRDDRAHDHEYYDTVTLPTMGTGATDMSNIRAKGPQCYGIGPALDAEDGQKGFGAHSDQERILIAWSRTVRAVPEPRGARDGEGAVGVALRPTPTRVGHHPSTVFRALERCARNSAVSTLLKDQYSREFVRTLAAAVGKVAPGFDARGYVRDVLSPPWNDLELKARMRRLAPRSAHGCPSPTPRSWMCLNRSRPPSPASRRCCSPTSSRCTASTSPPARCVRSNASRATRRRSSPSGRSSCATTGTMAQMRRWARHADEHVRRLASRGAVRASRGRWPSRSSSEIQRPSSPSSKS